jgi:excisionase family DNA binding protein
MTDDDRVLTVSEVGSLLRVSEATVRRMARDGRMDTL